MTDCRYFNVDPDRRSKFWNFNGSTFPILELELNEGSNGSTILDPNRLPNPSQKEEKSCLFHKKMLNQNCEIPKQTFLFREGKISLLFCLWLELELELDRRYFLLNGSRIGSEGKNGTGTGSDRPEKADRFMPCSLISATWISFGVGSRTFFSHDPISLQGGNQC